MSPGLLICWAGHLQLVWFTATRAHSHLPDLCAGIVVDAVNNHHITLVAKYSLCSRHWAECFASGLTGSSQQNSKPAIISTLQTRRWKR